MYPPILSVHFKKLARDLPNDANPMFLGVFLFSSAFLYNGTCSGYSFELYQQDDEFKSAPQHNAFMKK